MPDISKIKLENDIYNIKDATARADLEILESSVQSIETITQAEVDQITNDAFDSFPSPVYGYNTVADMQADPDLQEGMICHTSGFHIAGDGGAAYYMVDKDSSGINGFTVFSGQNGLYLHLMDIAINGYIDIRWTGAHSDYDGSITYTDNAPYFAKAFEYIAINPSTPIKIVGRFGLATQVEADYALQMFGEYRPSRELIASADYELKPVSEIFVASGITAFNLEGSGESRTFSFINLDNIKFTSSGRTSTLINAPTFGAPSRPNWIRGCEGSGFDNIIKSIGTSEQFSQGTTFFSFDISDCNFYSNNYVVYTDSVNATQQTIGGLSINNTVLEQGGGQLYINNSYGAISIVNALIENNTGTMHLHGATTDFMFVGNYFEANTLTIDITANNHVRSSTIFANNSYINENTTINVLRSAALLLDTIGAGVGVTFHASKYKMLRPSISSDTIADTTRLTNYWVQDMPSVVTPDSTQEVLGAASNDKRIGLCHNNYATNTMFGLAAKSTEADGYVVLSFYAFTSGTISLYTLDDSGVYVDNGFSIGLNVFVCKTTSSIRPRLRATGDISNVLVSFVSAADAQNLNPIDFAVCANKT